MSSTELAVGNRLLSLLPVEANNRLTPFLKPVNLQLSEILFHPGDYIDHVYFPTNSIVSLLTDLEDGSGLEVGLVGNEGLAGVSAFLGGPETKIATVQAEGMALKISADRVREAFAQDQTFREMSLRYTHALMSQISQSVVCNVRHAIEKRLARWLLMYSDRLARDEFNLTQEFIANMLGVRRASVSEIAGKLQELGYIEYSRGRVRITNRNELEAFACECYAAVKKRFDEMLLVSPKSSAKVQSQPTNL